MHGVARRKARIGENDVARPQNRFEVDRKDLVDDAQKRLQGRLDRVSPTDGDVAMQDLLQDLGVGDQALTVGDRPLEAALGIDFVRMRRADEVHRHVRVDEDQDSPSTP